MKQLISCPMYVQGWQRETSCSMTAKRDVVGQRPSPSPVPPKPPDRTNQGKDSPGPSAPLSFKDALLENQKEFTKVYASQPGQAMAMDDPTCLEEAIHLTSTEMQRLYLPQSASVIIKVFGKKIPYTYLRNKLVDLWRPSEPINLIDLGNDYHVVKFKFEANTHKVLYEGPWFVARNFVSVQKWEPNFVPQREAHLP